MNYLKELKLTISKISLVLFYDNYMNLFTRFHKSLCCGPKLSMAEIAILTSICVCVWVGGGYKGGKEKFHENILVNFLHSSTFKLQSLLIPQLLYSGT